MKVEWEIVVSTLIVVMGWFVMNWLGSRRETKKKKLELQAKYLISVYERLNHLRTHQSTLDQYEIMSIITSSIAEIELFGTQHQIDIARNLGQEVVKYQGNVRSLNPLVNDLRNALRKYLGLSEVIEDSYYFNLPDLAAKNK